MRRLLFLSRSRWPVVVSFVAVTLAVALSLVFWTDDGKQTALTWAQLRNATYPSEFPRSRQAPLQDGSYEEEIAPGAATKLRIQLADIGGFGEIDADGSLDAAVVLIGSPGGSGTFIHLVAVLNKDGAPVPIAAVLLGDRVAVRAIRIENHTLIVSMRVRGPTDPFALLTREVTRIYSLQDEELHLESEETVDAPSTPPSHFTYEPQRLLVDAGKAVTRQGTLSPGELVTYLVHGDIGQELKVTVRSQFSNAILSMQGVEDLAQLVSRTAYANSWSGRLPSTQDYAITVVTLAGNDLSYEFSAELRAVPTPAPTATTRPTLTATTVPGRGSAPVIPAPVKGQFHPVDRQLGSLSPGAAKFLDTRSPVWGAAVASPVEGMLYSQNGDAQLELASVVKVLVALAILDAAEQERRFVDRLELSLLWPMITFSDNDSTTRLWDQLGGGRGLSSYLASKGVANIKPYDGPFWGTSTASANALALLVARAAFGDLLNTEHRALFLDLLLKVTASQRWGISAGAEADGSKLGVVGLKDG